MGRLPNATYLPGVAIISREAALGGGICPRGADWATGSEAALEIWRKLTHPIFYYLCTKYWSDGDVHKYFSPYEFPCKRIALQPCLEDLRMVLADFEKPKLIIARITFDGDSKIRNKHQKFGRTKNQIRNKIEKQNNEKRNNLIPSPNPCVPNPRPMPRSLVPRQQLAPRHLPMIPANAGFLLNSYVGEGSCEYGKFIAVDSLSRKRIFVWTNDGSLEDPRQSI